MDTVAILKRVDHFLCAPRFENESTFPQLSVMKTYTAFLENIFGKYYEWKYTLNDYDWIPMDYIRDWNQFMSSIQESVKKKTNFIGICPVVFINIVFQDDKCIIKDLFLRPCAMGYPFLDNVLMEIAKLISSGTLEIYAFSAKRIPIADVFERLKLEKGTDYTEEIKYPYTYAGPPAYVYTISNQNSKRLQQISSMPFEPPNGKTLSQCLSQEGKLLRERMTLDIGNAGLKAYGAFWDDTNKIALVLDLNTKDLRSLLVFKGGYTYQYSTRQPIL